LVAWFSGKMGLTIMLLILIIPLPGSCANGKPSKLVDLRKLISHYKNEIPIWLDESKDKACSKEEVKEMFKVWLPSIGLLERYDVFLSYRLDHTFTHTYM
jgi:hypothetical protein